MKCKHQIIYWSIMKVCIYLGHITLISNWRRLYAVWQICYCDNEKVVILTAAWNHQNFNLLKSKKMTKLWHSIFIRTVSFQHLFSTWLQQFKLLYGSFGRSNMHCILDFCLRPTRKETNVQGISQQSEQSNSALVWLQISISVNILDPVGSWDGGINV